VWRVLSAFLPARTPLAERACVSQVDAADAGGVLLSSSVQIGHLLFGPKGEGREFKVLNPLYGQPLQEEQEQQRCLLQRWNFPPAAVSAAEAEGGLAEGLVKRKVKRHLRQVCSIS
jgi:hypothetical protein